MSKSLLVIIAVSLVILGLFIFSNIKADTDHLLISQVQITGGSGKITNDFVELYNPTSVDVDLKNYRLVKRTKIGTSDLPIKSWSDASPGSAIIKTHGFYLWANADFVNITVVPDTTTGYSIANDNTVALRNGPENSGTIIDSIAWGLATNTFIDGSVFASNPTANQSIERNLDGSGFFLQTTAHPRNSQSQTITTTPSDSPTPTETVTSAPLSSLTPTPSSIQTPTPEITSTPTPQPSPEASTSAKASEDKSAGTATPTSIPVATVAFTPTPIVTPGIIILTLPLPSPTMALPTPLGVVGTPTSNVGAESTPLVSVIVTPTANPLIAVISQPRPSVVRITRLTPTIRAIPSQPIPPVQSSRGFISWLSAFFSFFVKLF